MHCQFRRSAAPQKLAGQKESNKEEIDGLCEGEFFFENGYEVDLSKHSETFQKLDRQREYYYPNWF